MHPSPQRRGRLQNNDPLRLVAFFFIEPAHGVLNHRERGRFVVGKLRWALKGNLVLVRDGAINTLDTRELTGSGIIAAVATAVPGIAEVATVSPTPTPAPTAPTAVVLAEQPVPDGADSPAWLVLLVGTTGVAVTAIFVIAFWQARQRKRNLSGMG